MIPIKASQALDNTKYRKMEWLNSLANCVVTSSQMTAHPGTPGTFETYPSISGNKLQKQAPETSYRKSSLMKH